MYYNSKSSFGRLSEFAKSTKNVLLYGNQASMSTPDNKKAIGEQKLPGKLPPKVEIVVASPVVPTATQKTDEITQADLQQAIIWSEILGKPMSKRRERRYYGN